MLVFLNGHYIAARDASISPLDRGFLFGDGIYEVVRALSGKLVESERHWARLGRSLRETRIERPLALGDDQVSEIALRLLEENGLMQGHAIVYLEISRGSVSPRTHHFPPAGTPPTVYASAAAFTPFDGARIAGVSVILTPDERWARCDIKSVNLLPNAMAKQLAVDANAWEAIFVRDGAITEGTSSNCFAVIAGQLRTHPASRAILGGITREVTIAAARTLGIDVVERAVTVAELETADEAFLTSTTNDVMPIVRIDGRPVGNGAPGVVTRRLSDEVQRLLYR
jgi:D-alanine transaminase